MPAGRAAAQKLVILALGLGAIGLGVAACGDSTAKEQAAATKARVDANWRAGLTRWHRQMLGALNGISILLSSAAGVELLQASDRKTDTKLTHFDETLARCSAVVRELGPAPAELVEARKAALRACADLETGARLVEDGVKALRQGGSAGRFNRATTPLSTGQDEMSVAARSARRAPPP
jgi:hypothetical protein